MSIMEYYEVAAQQTMAKLEAAKAMDYIHSKTTHGELLAQLAEEAIELAHAALKFRRALGKENPTPVTREDAYAAVMEELADVTLLVRILALDRRPAEVEEICRRKLLRWCDRLRAREGKTND